MLTGVAAVDVQRSTKVVLDDRGNEHPYDELVLATGSAARVPPIQGVAYDEGLVEGVFVLKDMADATGIVAAAGAGRRAVVLGAGVLGVEVATGLARRGLAVRVVHLADRLMERQLGWEASQVAVAGLQRLGITTHVGASVVGVTTRRGRLESVRFGDGLEASADLFVMCTGTVPETLLARRGRPDLRPGGGRRRRTWPAPTTHTCTPSATARSRRPVPPVSSRRAGSRRRGSSPA